MIDLIVMYAVPGFLLLIVLEAAVGRLRRRRDHRLADTIGSLGLGMLGQVTGAFVGVISVTTYAWVEEHLAPARLPVDSWWTWAAAFLGFDLCFYWSHRLSHRVNFLWAAHVVHHASEEYNLSTALRQSSTTFLFAWILYLPLAALGVPAVVFGGAAAANLVYQFWPHTRLVGRLGPLDRWLVTPSNHRVHHGRDDACIDRNFGGVLVVWDRLFGTFAEEPTDRPVVFGVRDPLPGFDPVRAVYEPYLRLWRACRRAPTWGERVRILCGPPGAHPGAGDPGGPASRPGPELSAPLRAWCLVQFFLALAATLHFMAVHERLGAGLALAYGMAIVTAIMATGRLLEGSRTFLRLEPVRLIATVAGLTWLAATGHLRGLGLAEFGAGAPQGSRVVNSR